MQNYRRDAERSQQILGLIRDSANRKIRVSVKNPLSVGDEAIAISPQEIQPIRIGELTIHGNSVDRAYGAMGHEVSVLIDKSLTGSQWEYGILVKG
jgi:hypothetical protein